MAKFLDKTEEEWDSLIEQWHTDPSITISLPEFLGLDEVEYLRLMHNIDAADLTSEEIMEEAGRRVRGAVVGITIQNIFNRI